MHGRASCDGLDLLWDEIFEFCEIGAMVGE